MLRAIISFVLLMALITTDALGQNTVTIGSSPTADITDWGDEYCVTKPDPAACDDYPNQQDGKGACIATNYSAPGPANTAYLRYDFDEIGLNGNNTMDGCWLIDVNQNGNADRALCFSVSSSGGIASGVTTTLFSCNDSSSGACGGDMVMTSSAACAFNNDTADIYQLANCAALDKDLAIECSASLTDMGWSSGEIGLLWGCSSTSAQPNSSTFDCFGDPSAPLYIDPNTGQNYPVELQYFEIE